MGLERAGLLDDPSYISQLDPTDTLLRHENAIPFSTSVASFEALQLVALVLGPIHDLGDQNYHSVSGTLDRTEDDGCAEGCPYKTIVSTADRICDPTGPDASVERVRHPRNLAPDQEPEGENVSARNRRK